MPKVKVDNVSEWLEQNNRYELLIDEFIENDNTKAMLVAKRLTEQIDKILNEAADKVIKLSKTKSYAKLGIGDTATDEAIVSELYTLIH